MSRDPRGLRGAWTRHQRMAFPRPSPDLARHVERYWVVSWDYGDSAEPYRQLIVPYAAGKPDKCGEHGTTVRDRGGPSA